MDNNQPIGDTRAKSGERPFLTIINYAVGDWKFFRFAMLIYSLMAFFILYIFSMGMSSPPYDFFILGFCYLIYSGLLIIFGLETHVKFSLYKKIVTFFRVSSFKGVPSSYLIKGQNNKGVLFLNDLL